MLHCVNWQMSTSVLKEGNASKTSVSFYQLTWHNIPEDLIFNISKITFKRLETLIAICNAHSLLDIILSPDIKKNQCFGRHCSIFFWKVVNLYYFWHSAIL